MLKKDFIILLISQFLLFSSFGQYKESGLKYVDTLSSKTMLGRGYVKNGDKIAANYIEQEFKKIGLSPVGDLYQQSFIFDINTFEGKQSIILNRKPITLGVDYLVSANSPAGKGLVKVLPYEKFIRKKKAEKFGVSLAADKYAAIIKNEELKQAIDRSKIIIKTQNDKLTASLSQNQTETPCIEMLGIPKERSFRLDYKINAQLKKNYESQNVIGFIEGTEVTDSFMVFCAHYDHLGAMGNIYFPGANDNAAGIAMLFELAKHYKLHPSRYTIIFIAFGAEEVGLIGSKYFVENPLVELRNIRFVTNLDLMGTGEDGITVVNGKVYKKEFQLLVQINDKIGYLKEIKPRGKAANSDHFYFGEAGIPSFFIYTRGNPKHYHDIHDNGKDLDLKGFNGAVGLIIDFEKNLNAIRKF